ncbi:MAG: hypothetical protein M1828_001576 [Chrysothrix sp. TS-e1954]|nr:MAG: hypothetical protein M1828_001576 [Chrysothrix sp. TS-e1954]
MATRGPFDLWQRQGDETIQPYIIESTTHAIDKRNTPRGLQALINGKHIVTEQYIDAIIQATASPGFAEDNATPLPSPLEEDYEVNWPDAMQYLPAAGAKEVNPKDAHFFAADPARISVFEGFTFVFGDAKQHEQLQAPLTNGGAKCLLYEVDLGKTSPTDFAQRVREAAGIKGFAGDGDPDKGVVIVRMNRGTDHAEWVVNFLRDVDQDLGQRSVEQNEFLDAVLIKDTSKLRQPLTEESTQGIHAPPSTAVTTRGQTHASGNQTQSNRPAQVPTQESGVVNSQPVSAQKPPDSESSPIKRPIRRTITQSRFKGFDDFDESSLPRRKHSDIDEESEASVDNAPPSHQPEPMDADTHSQSLFVDESQPIRRSASPKKGANKRKATATQIPEDEEDMLDDMLPATRALKKRRLEAGEYLESPPSSPPPSVPTQQKEKKQVDIRSEARQHAEKIDKRRSVYNQQDHSVGNGVEGEEDISNLRNLAIVEEMEVVPRTARSHRNRQALTSQDEVDELDGEERWKPAWNGRRNFKRFRRAGQPPANKGQRVMVGLEEVKQKDFGIGESYWLESPERSRPSSRKNRASSSRSQRNQTMDDEDEEASGMEEVGPDTAPGESSVSTRNGRAATTRSSKRPGSGDPASQQPAAKRQKQRQTRLQMQAGEEEDSSDEDDLRFKFKKKKV